MNKKRSVSVGTLFFVITLLIVPLSFGSGTSTKMDYCKISVYASSLAENTPGQDTHTIIVADPPEGSEITNSISYILTGTSENITLNLSANDEIWLSTSNMFIEIMNFTEASEPNHYIINYEGEAVLWVNSTMIPEFPSILIAPLFMAITLLALIYRKKK